MVLFMLFIDFDYFILILFEIYTLLFFTLVLNFGSSYERGGANVFILFFGFVLRFGVVMSNNLAVIGFLLLILRLAKLPAFRLHTWLPKVHVEASIIRSIVLAGAVLKLGIIYIWNFGGVILVGSLMTISTFVIMSVIDGKGFAAYSSVLHMTMCVIFRLYVILLVRYMHVVLSPLMFMTVYMIYLSSGSRFYMKSRIMILILWIINFRLPFLGSFFCEVYIITYVRYILCVLIVMYIIVGYVMMKSINMDGKGLMYIPFMVLYLMII